MATIAATSPSAYWFITRGSGLVTLILLTLSVALGVANVQRLQTARVPRFVINAVHRNASLLAVVFLAIHIVTVLLDGYVHIRLIDAVVPFGAGYRPLWVGLGAIALDLMLAVVVTSLLRRHIGYRGWRATHWLAYACWPVALLHGLGTGSDAGTTWMQVVTGVCVAIVAAAVLSRLSERHLERRRGTATVAASAAVRAISSEGPWRRVRIWPENRPCLTAMRLPATRRRCPLPSAYRSTVTNRLGGDTVPLTRSGDTESTCSAMTGSTASRTTSDTVAGAGRCNARTSVLSTGASVALQVPSVAAAAVATVVAVPSAGAVPTNDLELDRRTAERRAAGQCKPARQRDGPARRQLPRRGDQRELRRRAGELGDARPDRREPRVQRVAGAGRLIAVAVAGHPRQRHDAAGRKPREPGARGSTRTATWPSAGTPCTDSFHASSRSSAASAAGGGSTPMNVPSIVTPVEARL